MSNDSINNLAKSIIDAKNSIFNFTNSLRQVVKALNYDPASKLLFDGKKPFELKPTEYGSFYLEDKKILKISTRSAAGAVLSSLCKHKSYFSSDQNILKSYGNPDEKVHKIMYDLKRSLVNKQICFEYQRTNNGYEITQCYWIK